MQPQRFMNSRCFHNSREDAPAAGRKQQRSGSNAQVGAPTHQQGLRGRQPHAQAQPRAPGCILANSTDSQNNAGMCLGRICNQGRGRGTEPDLRPTGPASNLPRCPGPPVGPEAFREPGSWDRNSGRSSPELEFAGDGRGASPPTGTVLPRAWGMTQVPQDSKLCTRRAGLSPEDSRAAGGGTAPPAHSPSPLPSPPLLFVASIRALWKAYLSSSPQAYPSQQMAPLSSAQKPRSPLRS